jgi:hypothetical protein
VARVDGAWRYDRRAGNSLGSLTRAGVDDVRIVLAPDLKASTIVTAGGDGPIMDIQNGNGFAVLGGGERVGYADVVAIHTPDDQIASNIHHNGGHSRYAKSCRRRSFHDIALGEGIQHYGRGGQTRRVTFVETPLRSAGCLDR